MKVIQKLKNKAGFTLAEVLAAVLILLMVSGIVAAGIPSAKNAYDKAVNAANAKVLLSTTVTSLRNELGKASNITLGAVAGGNSTSISYLSGENGGISTISLAGDSPSKIMIQEYMNQDPENGQISAGSVSARPLVSDAAATGQLYVTYTSIEHADDSNIVTIHGLTVKDGANSDRVMASLDSLVIRIITAS